MGSSSAPKQAEVASAPKQSALDIKRAQNDMQDDLRKRYGFKKTINAGDTGNGLSSVLG